MSYFIKSLRHIPKVKCVSKTVLILLTEIDLHKNHWLANQVDEFIVFSIFQDIQTKVGGNYSFKYKYLSCTSQESPAINFMLPAYFVH